MINFNQPDTDTDDKPKRGRPLGRLNDRTLAMKDILNNTHLLEAITNGEIYSPIEFLVDCYLDDSLPLETRIDCAKISAKYLNRAQPTMVEQTITQTDKQFNIVFTNEGGITETSSEVQEE